MMKNKLAKMVGGLVLSVIATGALAAPFSKLVAFSGSLSDTGNFASANGDFPPPFFNNRTTNGPVAIDILAGNFRLSSEPSLHLIGQQGGTNYAVLHANAAGNLPIDLPAQLQAYLGPRNNVADPNALYFIFIGANDIITATIEQDDQQSLVILDNAMREVETAFRRLHTAGARTFYAPNNVDLGIAPVTRDFGVSARATHFTIVFNELWERKLRQLERELDITIFRFDFFRFIHDLLPIGDTLGFTDTTNACLPLLPQGGCDLERFAFLNELLPTARIHNYLGNALALTLIEQLNSRVCTVRHRCGRKHGTASYAQIELRTDNLREKDNENEKDR